MRAWSIIASATPCFAVGLLTWVALVGVARSQEPSASTAGDPNHRGDRVFQSQAGVRISISTSGKDLKAEDELAALEQAARQVRERIKESAKSQDIDITASGTNIPVEPVPISGVPRPLLENAQPESEQPPAELPYLHWVGLPGNLLWGPQLANPLQPRMALMRTSLDNADTHETVDAAIGSELGLVRWLPAGVPGLMIQEDVFAVVLSRFAGYREAVAADYRFGFPTTFSYGNWQGKLGFEHTSTHLGDDFIQIHNRFKVGHIHDEVVAGLACRFWNQLRVYAVFAIAPGDAGGSNGNGDRYNIGVEWSKAETTGWEGQPFAACDLEFRADQGYQADVTTHVGWQWQRRECDCRATSLRVGLQFYDGKSPFGQFFGERERSLGAGIWVDF